MDSAPLDQSDRILPVDGALDLSAGDAALDGSPDADAAAADSYVPQACGATPHGGKQSRTRYKTASVPYGKQCVKEVQTRTCKNGTWTPWSGSYAHASCKVAPPNWCDGVPKSEGSLATTCAIKVNVCKNNTVKTKVITSHGSSGPDVASNCVTAAKGCLQRCGPGSSISVATKGCKNNSAICIYHVSN